eukprot:scaffold71019_cov39-Prasinocladus_malaysianus.AAC.1
MHTKLPSGDPNQDNADNQKVFSSRDTGSEGHWQPNCMDLPVATASLTAEANITAPPIILPDFSLAKELLERLLGPLLVHRRPPGQAGGDSGLQTEHKRPAGDVESPPSGSHMGPKNGLSASQSCLAGETLSTFVQDHQIEPQLNRSIRSDYSINNPASIHYKHTKQ